MDDSGGRRWFGWETALGGLLVLLGIVVGLGQALELELGGVGWPFFVIVPGLGVLGVGLAAAGRLGEVLATLGGLVTMPQDEQPTAAGGSSTLRMARRR
jgi:hypothetical protein